jgi:hypothetical protein
MRCMARVRGCGLVYMDQDIWGFTSFGRDGHGFGRRLNGFLLVSLSLTLTHTHTTHLNTILYWHLDYKSEIMLHLLTCCRVSHTSHCTHVSWLHKKKKKFFFFPWDPITRWIKILRSINNVTLSFTSQLLSNNFKSKTNINYVQKVKPVPRSKHTPSLL